MTERDIDLKRRSGMALQVRGLLLEIRVIEARHGLKPLRFERELGSLGPRPEPAPASRYCSDE